jgi:hypothetical protein
MQIKGFGDAFGQVGQLEFILLSSMALRTSSYAYGWNSRRLYRYVIIIPHPSAYSIISGRNNFNASYNHLCGTFNNPYLGIKTVLQRERYNNFRI